MRTWQGKEKVRRDWVYSVTLLPLLADFFPFFHIEGPESKLNPKHDLLTFLHICKVPLFPRSSAERAAGGDSRLLAFSWASEFLWKSTVRDVMIFTDCKTHIKAEYCFLFMGTLYFCCHVTNPNLWTAMLFYVERFRNNTIQYLFRNKKIN